MTKTYNKFERLKTKETIDTYNERKRKYEMMIQFGYVFVISSIGLAIPLTVIYYWTLFFMIPLIVASIVLIYKGDKQFKDLSNEFKSKFVPSVINDMLPGCTFHIEKGFDYNFLLKTRVIPRGDDFKSEDLLTGIYEGVRFQSADVRVKKWRRSGKSSVLVTVFLGRVYEFEFNKAFKQDMLIAQPRHFRPFEGWMVIKTESKKFNDHLKVFARCHHEALYILTPHFMESLLVLDQKYHEKIVFSFINKKLYIGINTNKDAFDLKKFTPISRKTFLEYQQELKDIQDFIHELNLEKDLFLNKKEK